MKLLLKISVVLFLLACNQADKKPGSEQLIVQVDKQISLFNSLVNISGNSIPSSVQGDSLAFLILPVEASCPSCRKKTIDSIISHKDNLRDGHFIIISAGGGRKTMNSYFRESNSNMPVIENRLFLDSTNATFLKGLYEVNPTIYYTHDKKVYKKVAAIPATVREDLREFFSGFRKMKHLGEVRKE